MLGWRKASAKIDVEFLAPHSIRDAIRATGIDFTSRTKAKFLHPKINRFVLRGTIYFLPVHFNTSINLDSGSEANKVHPAIRSIAMTVAA